VTQITNEELYQMAFYYVVGVISGMEYYEDIPEPDLVDGFLQRAEDIILEQRRNYEEG
jgi:hypothetical protein